MHHAQDDPFGGDEGAGGSQVGSNSQVRVRPVTQNGDHVKRQLRQRCNFDYDETPFIDVMSEIAENHNINVVLDQSAKDDSLSEDEPVTFSVTNLPLSNCLSLMLAEKNATFIVRDDVLNIISMDVASDPEFFRREVINCSKLLRLIASKESHRVGSPISVTPIQTRSQASSGRNGGGFGGGGKGGGVFSQSPSGRVFQIVEAQNEEELAKEIDKVGKNEKNAAVGRQSKRQEQPPVAGHYLVRTLTAESILDSMIRTSVAPDSWDDTNGDGTLVIVGGCVIVSNTESTIADIKALLDTLEAELARANQP